MTKYAVLISTGTTSIDDTEFDSEYWYDLILMYKTLVENGFQRENIFILYGEGDEFQSYHPEYLIPGIVNYPITEQNIQNIFTWLATGNSGIQAITKDDFLLVWWLGHGEMLSGQMHLYLDGIRNPVLASKISKYINRVQNFLKRALIFQTCQSAHMFDFFEHDKTVTETAAGRNTMAYSETFDVIHTEFTYHITCALREVDPEGNLINSDINNNNLVDLKECFDYASSQRLWSLPHICDPSGIAPCIFIKLPTPGKIIEIMSRDHIHDSGLIPSNYEEWFHGPDLWVRNQPDDIAEHQNPIYGQQNYLYARVFNIGCGTANNINVQFSWCRQTAWANPALWNNIGNTTIPALGSLQNVIVKFFWDNLPSPGTYCLHTRLNCNNDSVNEMGEAFMDNNKVQINVNIGESTASMNNFFSFFIENASRIPSRNNIPIDLEIDCSQKLRKTQIKLQFPGNIQFDQIDGIDKILQINNGDKLIDIKKDKTIIKGITLKKNSEERRRLFLSIKAPNKPLHGRSIIIIKEKVNDNIVGGIKFVSKISEFKTVAKKLIVKKWNLINGLIKELGLITPADFYRLRLSLRTNLYDDKDKFFEYLTTLINVEQEILRLKKVQDLGKFSEKLKLLYDKAFTSLKEALKKRKVIQTLENCDKTVLYLSNLLADFIERKDIPSQ